MQLTLEEALKKGIEAHKAGRTQEAEQLYAAILNAQPKHADANHNMGVLAVGIGKLDEALPFFKRALDSNPSVGQYWLSNAEALIKLKRVDEATKNLQIAIKSQPDFLEAHYNLGILQTKNDNLDEAIASYKRAIEIQPNHSAAHYNLGNIYKEKEQYDEALEHYRLAVQAKPDHAMAYNNMGIIFKKNNELNAALKSFKQATDINPNSAESHYNLGSVLGDQYELDSAIISFQKAIKIKPTYSEAYNSIGNIKVETCEPDEAIYYFRQAIKIKPNYREAHINIGNALFQKGDIKGTLSIYKKALQMYPSDDSLRHQVAALSGTQTFTAPRAYTEQLFDGFASQFENKLKLLNYRAHIEVAGLLIKRKTTQSLGSIVDLGCGTGLAGSELVQFCDNLEGVDLSRAMLREAEKKNLYSQLHHIDILKYLQTTELNFNYFIAVDVFIYVGDLSEIFALIKSRNQVSGKLVFSTEHRQRGTFFLESSGRYSHSTQYIEKLCLEFKYKISFFSQIDLRIEKDKLLKGGLYILDF